MPKESVNPQMKVWVIIPAYNEGRDLRGIIRKIKKKNLSVLVVDDGSTDSTFDIACREADKVIHHKRNLGKGRALQEGITYLLKHYYFDCIITMDGDGQHSPLELDRFLEEAEGGECFVVGNRMEHPWGMPKLRILTNKFMSWLISKITRQKIPDTQCGFRLIKRNVLEKINIRTSKFEIESELLIEAARNNFFIKSIPIESIYFKEKKSKIHPFLDTVRFMRFIFHLAA